MKLRTFSGIAQARITQLPLMERVANFKKWGAVPEDFNPRVLSGGGYMYRASDIELMWDLVDSGKLHQAFDAYYAKRNKE